MKRHMDEEAWATHVAREQAVTYALIVEQSLRPLRRTVAGTIAEQRAKHDLFRRLTALPFVRDSLCNRKRARVIYV
jgi:hypothetical protein